MVLGESLNEGYEVDFCVERQNASPEATSKMRGMAGLVWSANPKLSGEKVLEFLIQSNHFYNTNAQKDERLGRGMRLLYAVESALETLQDRLFVNLRPFNTSNRITISH